MNIRPQEHCRRRRMWLPLLALCCTALLTGCASTPVGLHSSLSPCHTEMKARRLANKTWRQQYAHCYCDRSNAKDIKIGFIDGFVAIALGRSGCPPLVAPKSTCTRKINGHKWFQGYPLGVAAAESCGVREWNKTVISPQLMACIAQTGGCLPGCVECQQAAEVSAVPYHEPPAAAPEAAYPEVYAAPSVMPLTDDAVAEESSENPFDREEPTEPVPAPQGDAKAPADVPTPQLNVPDPVPAPPAPIPELEDTESDPKSPSDLNDSVSGEPDITDWSMTDKLDSPILQVSYPSTEFDRPLDLSGLDSILGEVDTVRQALGSHN